MRAIAKQYLGRFYRQHSWKLQGPDLSYLPHRCMCGQSDGYIHKRPYDVVIVGGGVVGKCLAAAIARKSSCDRLRVLLLDSGPKPQVKSEALPEEYSNRVTALSPSSRELLHSVGAWDIMETMRICPVKSMQVWETKSEAAIYFAAGSSGESVAAGDSLAYIVENDVIMAGLDHSLSQNPRAIDIVYSEEVSHYVPPSSSGDPTNPFAKIYIKGNEDPVRTSLVIGADGYNSQVRRSFALPDASWSYQQHAVVATLQTSQPLENNTAWQRFLPSGPIALLPLSAQRSSLVWSLPPDRAAALLLLSAADFVDEVNKALWTDSKSSSITEQAMTLASRGLEGLGLEGSSGLYQLPPTFCEVTGRARFPLGFMLAGQYATHGAALVGDAAHRIHPLAGQGLNLGLGDAQVMSKVLSVCASEGGSPGELQYLQQYETERQCSSVPIIVGVDALYRLYSNQSEPVVVARSLGVMVANAIPAIKSFFKMQATK